MRLAVECWNDVRRDARHALRLLRRAPGFTAAAVLCLSLGTGLATAVYSQVQSTVLAPLPGAPRAPDSLVRFHRPVSFAEYEALVEGAPSVARLAGYISPVPMTVTRGDGGDRRRVWGELATPNYFDVLGIQPLVGRLFGPVEEAEGATSVVIGERLWRSQFGGEDTIAGESIRVNGRLVTVLGVASAGFVGASPMTAGADLWVPTTAAPGVAPELALRRDRRSQSAQIVGRLLAAGSTAQAEAVFGAIAGRVEPLPDSDEDPARAAFDRAIRLLPGGRMLAVRDEDLPRAIGFPIVLVGLVLVVACGNVANLVLSRAATRQREISVRLAVGASRGRIAGQLVTESLILSLFGTVGGAAVAVWLLSYFGRMSSLLPEYVHHGARFDWGAFAATAMVACVSTVCFSLAPSLRASRQDIHAALKPNASSGLRGFRRFGLRNLVVCHQVALSVVLLLLTGSIVWGWLRTANVNLGFQPERLYFLHVDPVRDGRPPAEAAEVVARLRDRLRTSAGIESVSLAQTVPLAMSGEEVALGIRADLTTGTRSLGATRVDRVGAGFFETVGTALVRGRGFSEAEHSNASRVAVVNETMAQTTWPGADPVGRPLTIGNDTWEVVGLVRDTRSAFPLSPTLPAVYLPVTPAGFETPTKNGVTLAVRTTPGVDGPAVLRAAARSIDPDLTVVGVKPLSQEVDQALFLVRVATVVYGGMGVFGLILAAVGLSGVTAYAVARRTPEIGIRMALGARRSDVLRLVLREGAGITFVGTAAGTALALLTLRAMASLLEAVAEVTRASATDVRLVLGGPVLLLALALIACYVPARRSMRIDPTTALRSE